MGHEPDGNPAFGRGDRPSMAIDTRTFYDRLSGAYDLIADASEGACREQGLGMLAVQRGERVLEVGFGTGHALAALACASGTAGHVVGIDISSGMLNVARRRIANAGAHTVSFAIDDARALSFPSAVFDAAFMSFTLELFDAAGIAGVLREVRRVLRPAGRLAVVTMAETADANVVVEIYTWLHRHFPHFIDCRPIDAQRHLEDAGFRITDAIHMTIWGLPVAAVVGVTGNGAQSLELKSSHLPMA